MKYPTTYTSIPFNEDFCTHLEYRLGLAFNNSGRVDLKGFWCDGISSSPIPEWQLSRESVLETGKIITKAWIGKDGQEEYEMTIHFGTQALNRYARGKELIDCIPDAEFMNWLEIETVHKKIWLRLN